MFEPRLDGVVYFSLLVPTGLDKWRTWVRDVLEIISFTNGPT